MQNFVTSRLRRLAAALFLPALAVLAACEGDGGATTPVVTDRLAVVLNSVDNSLTVLSAGEGGTPTRTIGLGPQGTPVGLAVRGERAVVPMGTYPFAVVANVVTGQVERTVALPAGSGATGAAFLNDSIAVVANPALNSVTPINVRTGAALPSIPVGVYPQHVLAYQNRLYVVNANLVNFAPAGPGSVTVIGSTLQVSGTVQLSGRNPGAAVGSGGRVFVLNSGDFGQSNGSVSVLGTAPLSEVAHVTGFGSFPGAIDALDGEIYVAVYDLGVLVWNSVTGTFVRGVNNPIRPNNTVPVSNLRFDPLGRLYTLNPGTCQNPGTAYRLGATAQAEWTAATGICPFDIEFVEVLSQN